MPAPVVTVVGLVVGGSEGVGVGRLAVCWPALDAAQADQTWQDLAGWVTDVLGPFYRITRGQLPDCWARHPDAVIELVWLHTCYREALGNDKGRPTAAAEWHTRWRPAALAALADAIPERLCRPGEHLIPTRESDAARSDARDARAMATAPGPSGGGRGGPQGYQPPAPAAAGSPSDAPTGQRRYDPARDQVTTPAHWGRHYEAAKADDLAWRQAREADTPHLKRPGGPSGRCSSVGKCVVNRGPGDVDPIRGGRRARRAGLSGPGRRWSSGRSRPASRLGLECPA